MNQNPTDFFSAMEKISRENDKALRSLFGKYIKGNFLIEMKHFIMDNLPEIKPEFESLEYALDETFRRSDKVGVMLWGFPEMIRYNGATKTTSSRLYVFEKRYTDKLSACADLNMKDKIELQSFCDEIFGDG